MSNMDPYSADKWDEDHAEDVSDIKVVTIFGENRIRPLFVIVETWDHKGFGNGKRLWLKEFNEKERKIITKYHGYLYTWYLRTGIPRRGVQMKPSTYELLTRAANFFASI